MIQLGEFRQNSLANIHILRQGVALTPGEDERTASTNLPLIVTTQRIIPVATALRMFTRSCLQRWNGIIPWHSLFSLHTLGFSSIFSTVAHISAECIIAVSMAVVFSGKWVGIGVLDRIEGWKAAMVSDGIGLCFKASMLHLIQCDHETDQ